MTTRFQVAWSVFVLVVIVLAIGAVGIITPPVTTLTGTP